MNEKIFSVIDTDVLKSSLSAIFNENTKLNKISIKLFGKRIMNFSASKAKPMSIYSYKCYPRCKSTFLENAIPMQEYKNIIDCICKRRTIRDYKGNGIVDLATLSTLLTKSYGISQNVKVDVNGKVKQLGLRCVPSAGALYPLEIYIALYKSTIDSGIYHYRVDNNSIEKINEVVSCEKMEQMIGSAHVLDMKNISMVVFITVLPYRYIQKYGDRGYRFAQQEIGAVVQNLSLLSTSLGWGTCVLGGFLDDEINDYLKLNGYSETVSGVLVIGK